MLNLQSSWLHASNRLELKSGFNGGWERKWRSWPVSKALLLFFWLWAVSSRGQTASPGGSPVAPGSSRSHRGAAPGGERSMKGCLTLGEGGEYVLQTQRSARVKLESPEDLSSRIGRQIKVTGAFVDTQPPTSGGQAATSHSRASSSLPSHFVRAFRVFRVDVLSQTCTARKK